ncbi:pyrimidine reductase family protein [Microbacterium sp. XT11]|uniref:pyrimidine reductase family protein n=1 Tax=Microbacterium sp. XT11 TaxID=367477 RepID=UPI000742E33C|nr:pyrimidine reductase family protein [Microbacterium sp. XT11]ALX66367.1 diaminohydroxyphosphoribosylaminopyrimidine deaminase [Microbacterium sp. XT11]
MTSIDRLWPDPEGDLDDERLLELTRMPDGPWLRMNFISSIDGAATQDGRSGGLGDDADRRLFGLLRWDADAVLVGAGTARAEGYAELRVAHDAVAWRIARGLPPQPTLVLVSASLDLDPDDRMFAEAPVRPVVCTVPGVPSARRDRIAEVADVVVTGGSGVDPQALRRELAARGLRRVHAEGGPTLFASFLEAGAVDALHLTLAPRLQNGSAGRIVRGGTEAPTGMRLESVLRAGDELLLRYTRS